jgi:hypothetical protein
MVCQVSSIIDDGREDSKSWNEMFLAVRILMMYREMEMYYTHSLMFPMGLLDFSFALSLSALSLHNLLSHVASSSKVSCHFVVAALASGAMPWVLPRT